MFRTSELLAPLCGQNLGLQIQHLLGYTQLTFSWILCTNVALTGINFMTTSHMHVSGSGWYFNDIFVMTDCSLLLPFLLLTQWVFVFLLPYRRQMTNWSMLFPESCSKKFGILSSAVSGKLVDLTLMDVLALLVLSRTEASRRGKDSGCLNGQCVNHQQTQSNILLSRPYSWPHVLCITTFVYIWRFSFCKYDIWEFLVQHVIANYLSVLCKAQVSSEHLLMECLHDKKIIMNFKYHERYLFF